MRYIPTSDETVEQLRKQAKQLQRKHGGKHTELLDKVSKQANYDHWHHVVQCNGRGKAASSLTALRRECEAIIAAELKKEIKIVLTGPEVDAGAFVLFSTGIGDAWLLDPSDQHAMCLVLHHERIEPAINENPLSLGIGFHGMYELRGDFFYIESKIDEIGARAIGGYPLSKLRPLLEKIKPVDIRMAETIGQFDTVEMTPEVIQQMAKKGYSEEHLLQLKTEGYRYSPSRDSLLGPIISSDDEDFLDS